MSYEQSVFDGEESRAVYGEQRKTGGDGNSVGKKESTTEKPAVNTRDEGIQYVDSMEEAMSGILRLRWMAGKVVYRVKK